MEDRLQPVFAEVLRRNPGEVEFHQAVREVFESLGPVLRKNPQYVEAA
ncbi:MAG TPA: glutamate dehydrogenase, partial [Isoptericola sp.]|nr:glutamate dehydrogenase [Isoptericola sp.]